MRLSDYANAFRRYWLAIVLMIALGAGVGFGWAKLQTPVYQADASGYITLGKKFDADTFAPGQADGLAKSKVPTYLDMATWRSVAERAGAEISSPLSPEALVQRITVDNPQGTAILKITARADSPTAARDVAAAWVTALAAEIDRVEGNGQPQSAELTISLGESASLPTAPIFPDERLAIIVGIVLGLGGGIGFALIRAIADRRLRTPSDIEQRLHVPVAGTLPDVDMLDEGRRLFRPEAPSESHKSQRADFAVRESLRMLRTNLQFMNVDNPPRTIVVTSAQPGEGKSTVAANLAGTLAANGAHVILVDGDLRRPTVADSTGVDGAVGLTDVLAGRLDITDALQRVRGVPNLLVLPAGTLPPNPSELAGSERMHSLLADLAEHAMVIVDAPPLLAVTDGAVLTRAADGALVVVAAGRTSYDNVEDALGALEKIHGTVLGVVLNRVPLASGSNYSAYAYEAAPHAPTSHRPKKGDSGQPSPKRESRKRAKAGQAAGPLRSGATQDDALTQVFGLDDGA